MRRTGRAGGDREPPLPARGRRGHARRGRRSSSTSCSPGRRTRTRPSRSSSADYPLDQLFQVVLEERGGAPLHFLLAWAIAHLGLGLEGLRHPLGRVRGREPAGRRRCSARGSPAGGRRSSRRCSWRRAGRSSSTASTDGCTASSSSRARSRTWRSCARSSGAIVARWALWALAILATVATHPYGAIVLTTQGVVRAGRAARPAAPGARRLRRRRRARDSVLAHRSRARGTVRRRGRRAAARSSTGRSPSSTYLWHVLGDFTTGWWPLLLLVAALGVVGLAHAAPTGPSCSRAAVVARADARVRRRALRQRDLAGDPPPHLRAPVRGAGGRCRDRPAAAASRRSRSLALVVAQLAWAWQKTPPLFEWEPDARQVGAGRGLGLPRGDEPPRRRPLRLRAALSRRLGAETTTSR